MVFLPDCIYLLFSTFLPEGIIRFHPVVLAEIDENVLLILSRNGMDLNTLGEPDRIPWRMHNPPEIQVETMGKLLRKHLTCMA